MRRIVMSGQDEMVHDEMVHDEIVNDEMVNDEMVNDEIVDECSLFPMQTRQTAILL